LNVAIVLSPDLPNPVVPFLCLFSSSLFSVILSFFSPPAPLVVDVNSPVIPSPPINPEDELKNFLHMVASTELRIPKDVDPSKPLSRDVYIVDIGGSWLKQADVDPPVIVFSKTYCPYSKKAKELLASYDISPPAKIVEVDLREDNESLKIILQRLTNHGTFPNIFIAGRSIGGSDDLQRLHESNDLVSLLTDAGESVLGNIGGNEAS